MKIENEQQIEIEFLKKYNKKMFLLKTCLVSIILIIFIICSIFFIKYKYNNIIIEETYDKIQEIKSYNNYSIYLKQHYIYHNSQKEYFFDTTIQYKDGYYKEIHIAKAINENINNSKYIYYGKIDTNERTEVYEDSKRIINKTSNFIYMTEEKIINQIYSGLKIYATTNGVAKVVINSGIKIENNKYEGKECYVLKFSRNNTNCREIWIDKTTNLPVREVQETDDYYYERSISLYNGNVKDEDISFNIEEGYSIENTKENKIKGYLHYYENFN